MKFVSAGRLEHAETLPGVARAVECIRNAVEVGRIGVTDGVVRSEQFDVITDHFPGEAQQTRGALAGRVGHQVETGGEGVLQRPGARAVCLAVDPLLQAAVTERGTGGSLLRRAAVSDVQRRRIGEEVILGAQVPSPAYR